MHRIDFRKVSRHLLESDWCYTTTAMGDEEHSRASACAAYTQLNYENRDHVQGLDLVGRTSQQHGGRGRCRDY
jgi:hypothetical protein